MTSEGQSKPGSAAEKPADGKQTGQQDPSSKKSGQQPADDKPNTKTTEPPAKH